MEEIKNLPKTHLPSTAEDFEILNDLCMDVYNEKNAPNLQHDWTDDDINLFIQQFNGSQKDQEDDNIDMNKLDPKFITYSEIAEKFEGFDDSVIQMIYECENKKLEDARCPPLMVEHKNVKLVDNLSTLVYIEDEANSKSDASCKDRSAAV